jgi:cytochrome c-type biogenesis protein CcmH/NrfG
VALYPGLAEAHYNLGYALLAKGRVGDALDQFQMQVNLEPDSFKAQENMGSVLLQNELAADAIPFLEKAVAIKGDDAQAHYLLANALFRSGRVRDAIGQYETCLQLNPDHVKACNDLAWILSCNGDPTLRNGTKAVELAMHAEQLSGGQNPVVMGTLAAAYAEAGKFAEAVSAETRARQIALSQTNNTLAELLEERLRAYEAGMPWRSN